MITYNFGKGLHIIGGRPCTGKTTFMLQHALANNNYSSIYSLDMTLEKLYERYKTVRENNPYISDNPIYIRDDLTSIENIRKDAGGRDGDIYIDFLQLIKSDKHFDCIEDERKYISDELYKLSRDRCVIVFSALNQPAKPSDFSPEIFRFYENIEEIADTVIRIYVPDNCFDEENRNKISKALFVCSGSLRGIVETGRHNASGCFLIHKPE